MTVMLCLILFVAPSAIFANVQLDQATLLNVFGSAPPSHSSQGAVQALAVTPDGNATLVDLEYWDSNDDFTPSLLDYDKFDWTLTKRVSVVTADNFLLSPLSLKLALAVLTEAATGATQAELTSVLGFDPDRKTVRSKFSTIIGSLETKSSQYILNLGSRIYLANKIEPRQKFAAIAQESYKTELKSLDFGNPPLATQTINAWVANVTQGRIPQLVTEDDVTGIVVMVLDTLYFKGTWNHQFAPNETKVGPFYVTPTVQKQVPFMKIKSKFYYAESTKFDAKILRLPYLGKKFAMYIIVPNSLMGLSRVVNSISDLRTEMQFLREKSVEVTMPKFQFDYTSYLENLLRELGIRQAFEDTASFPGIARGQLLSQRLRVSRVLQKSGIEVNELGSTAYSATEIALVNKFGEDGESIQEVIANKPFLFFIEDEATRQLLFTGRVTDPSQAGGAFKLG